MRKGLDRSYRRHCLVGYCRIEDVRAQSTDNEPEDDVYSFPIFFSLNFIIHGNDEITEIQKGSPSVRDRSSSEKIAT